MHRDDVEKLLGRPEEYGYPRASGCDNAGIWWYGSMEVRFGRDHDRVRLIYNNSFNHIEDFAKHSRAIELTDLFFFENNLLLNQRQVERKLAAHNLTFQYYENVEYDTISLVCESGVEIYFQKADTIDGSYFPYSIQKSVNAPEDVGFTKIEGVA